MTTRLLSISATISGLALACPALATPTNFVTNGSFEQANVTAVGQNESYFNGNVTGWGGGAALTFIDSPGQAAAGGYLSVYGPFPTTSPDGGNFVEADGDPSFSSAITQTLTGLTAGQQYTVSFYQAAGQQVGFTGPTTEQWSVDLGSAPAKLSQLFSLPQGGVGPWQAQSLTFLANASSDVLSFLAVGTPGGAPPISFLDGVSVTQTSVPEPGTVAVLAAGLGGLFFARRRLTR